jgi:hypothetical protein
LEIEHLYRIDEDLGDWSSNFCRCRCRCGKKDESTRGLRILIKRCWGSCFHQLVHGWSL